MPIMHRFAPVWDVLKVVAIVFIVTFIVRVFLFQPFYIEGSSMEPDFHNGEYILIEKVAYRFKLPARGDVVVFRYPNNPSLNYIKRLIGLPGETVRIEKGQVSINGNALTESYLASGDKTMVGSSADPYEITLGKDQFFVLGDNRQHSSDSRDWGPLVLRFIMCRATIVIYPRVDFHAIASPSY